MSQKNHQDEKTGPVFENNGAITVDYEGDEDLTVRPCPIAPRTSSSAQDGIAAVTVEFEGGEEDSRIRPMSPELLEQIRHFKPQV